MASFIRTDSIKSLAKVTMLSAFPHYEYEINAVYVLYIILNDLQNDFLFKKLHSFLIDLFFIIHIKHIKKRMSNNPTQIPGINPILGFGVLHIKV